MSRIIVIVPEYGIFLGEIAKIAVFSKNSSLKLSNAYGFADMIEARYFMQTNMPTQSTIATYVEIQVNEKYVSCVDIIQAGYAEHTGFMMDHLYMPSVAVH